MSYYTPEIIWPYDIEKRRHVLVEQLEFIPCDSDDHLDILVNYLQHMFRDDKNVKEVLRIVYQDFVDFPGTTISYEIELILEDYSRELEYPFYIDNVLITCKARIKLPMHIYYD